MTKTNPVTKTNRRLHTSASTSWSRSCCSQSRNAKVPAEPEPACAPAPAWCAPSATAEDEEDTVFKLQEALEARGIRHPEQLVSYQEELMDCPPDLEAMIGIEAVQETKSRVCSNSIRFTSGKHWWEFGLPCYVKHLRHQRGQQEQEHAFQLEAEVKLRHAAEERAKEKAREVDEINEEMDELRDELDRAKGREEALHAVIHRCRWG